MQRFNKKLLAVAVVAAGMQSYANAGETIQVSDNVTFDWKGTATYALSARTEDPDSNLSSSGNNNFDKHDLINNSATLLLEGHLRGENSGLVMSGNVFYDDVYRDDKFMDSTREYHGFNGDVLDFYAYTAFPFGKTGYADIRVGRHVVAWGEGLFFPSMSIAQGPSDAIKAAVPGAEVKEILLPEDQISFQVELTPDWSVMAHYQYGWTPTVVPEPGSFWSKNELTGKGAFCFAPNALAPSGCGYAPRTADNQPGDDDQWGVGTRYRISQNTEIGLYYLNYSDRIPLPEFDFGGTLAIADDTYSIQYAKDVKLYGATFSTTTGMNSFAGELTYKEGAPIVLANGAPSTSDVLQTTLNAITNFGRTSFAENATLTSELSYVDIRSIDGKEVSGHAFGPFTYSDEALWTNHGLAFAASLSLSYPGITENWDLSVPLSYQRQISGRVLTGGLSGSGAEGDQRVGIGATFTHPRTGIQVALKYAAYIGDADETDVVKKSSDSDRDSISLTVKYAF